MHSYIVHTAVQAYLFCCSDVRIHPVLWHTELYLCVVCLYRLIFVHMYVALLIHMWMRVIVRVVRVLLFMSSFHAFSFAYSSFSVSSFSRLTRVFI
jgi:hypothetical protein